MPKKTEKGDPLRLFNIHSVAEHQKIEGGLFAKKFQKVSMPKKSERPFRISWYCMLRGKTKNLFGSVR